MAYGATFGFSFIRKLFANKFPLRKFSLIPFEKKDITNNNYLRISYSILNLTLFYTNSKVVNPTNTGFPRIKYGAGLVKPGMTKKGIPKSLH